MASHLTFNAFGQAALSEWLVTVRASYVDERVAAGDSQQEAEANATAALDRLVPAGSPGPGQLIGSVCCDHVPVGYLWIGPADDDPQRWWVWDISIDEAHRGQGYGRRAMVLAEQLARAAGATTIGLNVFASNTVARHLYSSLNYEESSVQMRKDL